MRAEESWLDRLAVAHTRRQGFKVALATALGAIPLLRARPARAAAERCTRPCFYTAQVKAGREREKCKGLQSFGYVASVTHLFAAPVVGALPAISALVDSVHCADDAYLGAKAAQFDCLQANCGNWQEDPDILCPGCVPAGGKCCPAPSSSTGSGYLCCPNCNPNGDGCVA